MPSVDITEAELNRAIAEIAALTEPPQLEPGEVTSTMLAKWKDITRKQAAYRLERAHENGMLMKREIKHGGHKLNAYKKVAPVTESVTSGD